MPHPIADSQSVDCVADGRMAEYPYHPQPALLPMPEVQADISEGGRGAKGSPVLAIVLAVIFGWCNFLIVPVMEAVNPPGWGIVPVFVLVGVIFAEAALVSLALVFGDEPFWRRLITCTSAIIVAWGIWELGFIASHLYHGWKSYEYADAVQYTGLVLPMAAIGVQSPLWIFRLYFGWRLTKPTKAETRSPPLGIRDYLVGTAIAAVAVSFARLAVPLSWDAKDYWPGWALFLGVAGVTSLASVPPAMLLIFRLSNWRIGYCLLVAYGIVGGLINLSAFMTFDKSFRNDVLSGTALWDPVALVIVYLILAIFLGAGLKAARNLGFELVLGRKRP